MSDEEVKEVRQTARIPKDIHTAIVRLPAGDVQHPATSFNKALVFVLRAGLEAIAKQQKS